MWGAELFGDLKRHGFDLASTHLRHIERLPRPDPARRPFVSVAGGDRLAGIQIGDALALDRRNRRDLSLFQIGLPSIEQSITNGLPLRILWRPYWN